MDNTDRYSAGVLDNPHWISTLALFSLVTSGNNFSMIL